MTLNKDASNYSLVQIILQLISQGTKKKTYVGAAQGLANLAFGSINCVHA